jgi:hypothetical protein
VVIVPHHVGEHHGGRLEPSPLVGRQPRIAQQLVDPDAVPLGGQAAVPVVNREIVDASSVDERFEHLARLLENLVEAPRQFFAAGIAPSVEQRASVRIVAVQPLHNTTDRLLRGPSSASIPRRLMNAVP